MLTSLAVMALFLAPATAGCEAGFEPSIARELAVIQRGMHVHTSVLQEDRNADQRALMAETMGLLAARDRAVSQLDLDILDRALTLLHSEAVWDRADDRNCRETDTSWSIFCALHQASIAVTGGYEHRRTALQEVRFIIQDRSTGRDYAHRMMDYNNDPTTDFEAARSTITQARAVVAARLDAQCPG
ncbi:hypothetical protein [Maricaulis sp.]|uniref:hypothetical protein n=1 Tax=Maricaulis sp. TaxID=1486257 RepID=UPI002B26CBF2|nr:hypothetical protein [Maricaulis sp.]